MLSPEEENIPLPREVEPIHVDHSAAESFALGNVSNDFQESQIVLEPLVDVVIGPQHFELLKLIGEGAFGKVILVRNRLDKNLFAMKVISKAVLKKKNNIQYMKSERDILTKVNHPFIVSLKYAFQAEKKLFLVMEFLSGGELFFHLRRRGLISEDEIRFYLAEMILAIEFLHNLGVLHRDLKPENVLLRGNGHVCLTDFGLAKELRSSDEKVRTLCGTNEYMAPEMLTRNGYGKAVDWWALGALCFEMLTGSAPFTAKTEKELYKKILNEKVVTPSYLTAPAHSLLKGMLDKDMSKRLGAAKSTMFSIGGVTALKQHDFFRGLDWDALIEGNLPPPIDLSPRGDEESSATAHFHEGFTSQQLSPSVIDDTYSAVSSPGRSRAGSGSDDMDPFSGFEYCEEPFKCSAAQLEAFETELSGALVKLERRRALRARREEDRAEKAAVEAEARRAQAQREKEELEERERVLFAEKMRKEEERAAREAEENIRKEREVAKALYEAQAAAWAVHVDKVEKAQRRLKAVRKKRKDVSELEERARAGQKLSSEQKQKMGRWQELDDEIAELEELEEGLAGAAPINPGPPPPELFPAGAASESAGGDESGGGGSLSPASSAGGALSPQSSAELSTVSATTTATATSAGDSSPLSPLTPPTPVPTTPTPPPLAPLSVPGSDGSQKSSANPSPAPATSSQPRSAVASAAPSPSSSPGSSSSPSTPKVGGGGSSPSVTAASSAASWRSPQKGSSPHPPPTSAAPTPKAGGATPIQGIPASSVWGRKPTVALPPPASTAASPPQPPTATPPPPSTATSPTPSSATASPPPPLTTSTITTPSPQPTPTPVSGAVDVKSPPPPASPPSPLSPLTPPATTAAPTAKSSWASIAKKSAAPPAPTPTSK